MFKAKSREDEDTLIRPYVPADKLPVVPYIAPDSSEIPTSYAQPHESRQNLVTEDRPKITDVWQFNRSGEVIYPRRNQYWLWMIRPLLRPLDFTGRSPRLEFVLFWLLTVAVVVIHEELVELLSATTSVPDTGTPIVLTLMVALLAVSFRRVHDVGKSGLDFLVGFFRFSRFSPT